MPLIFCAAPGDVQRRFSRRGVSRLLWIWSPALVACAIIAGESTAVMSSANTSHFFRPLFEALFGKIADPMWDSVHHLLRKTGHFLGYGVVCVAFLRTWLLSSLDRGQAATGSWRLRATLLALASTFLIASADEFHQTFIPGRTGMFSDVLLDTSGATLMCALVWLVCRDPPPEAGQSGAAGSL